MKGLEGEIPGVADPCQVHSPSLKLSPALNSFVFCLVLSNLIKRCYDEMHVRKKKFALLQIVFLEIFSEDI